MALKGVTMLPRVLAGLAQLITFAGFVIIVAGLATIQKTTNDLGPPADIPAETVQLYTETYTQALVQPYPARHGFQFAYIWFIIFFELSIFLFTVAITVIPGLLHTCRAAALSLLSIAATLVITVVNNLVFFHKSPAANAVYGSKHIQVTLVGALLVVIGNGFTILTLGIGSPVAPHTHTVKHDPAVPATVAV